MYHWDWNHYGMPMMWLIWIPLIILITWLVFRISNPDPLPKQKKESPLDILKKRYAGGDITTEEFEQRKKVLERE